MPFTKVSSMWSRRRGFMVTSAQTHVTVMFLAKQNSRKKDTSII